MKKSLLLIPSIVAVGAMPFVSMVSCGEPEPQPEPEPFDGIVIDVNQNVGEGSYYTTLQSSSFTIDVNKAYRFKVDCSASLSKQWDDIGMLTFFDLENAFSTVKYEAIYVELDGEELPYSGSIYIDKFFCYVDTPTEEEEAIREIFFSWRGHTLNPKSKMVFDIKFKDSATIWARWINYT